ncbi:MAG: MarR family winged helix-turn-helix transcriptional regulator [Myxococcota bacterium]
MIDHDADSDAVVWGNFVVQLFRTHGLMMSIGDDIASAAGQTSARWQVIASVAQAPQTVPNIARRMGLSRQSVQRTVYRLVEDGIVGLASNAAHRRSPLVSLTDRGQTAMEAIRRRQQLAVHRWKNRIPTEKVSRALELLQDIERSLGETTRELPRPSKPREE